MTELSFAGVWRRQGDRFTERKRGEKQGCSLNPYLFNISIDNINYMNENTPHAPVIGMTILGLLFLLFADDVAFPSLTIKGFQKAIDQVTK
jgi:hypothetical protein